MVTERKQSEGEIVHEEGAAGVAAVTGGADFTPPTGMAGGKGKKRGKRSRHGHKTERSEVGVQTGGLVLMCLRPLTPAWRRNVKDQTTRSGLTGNHPRDEPEPAWPVVPWSVCTPVVRLYRPVTTNRSNACLIQINVLPSLSARRRGDISTPGRQNSPSFVFSLSLFSSPEKTAARNKGRRVSRNVRAAAGEFATRRIPPHLPTYVFLSPACFPPSRSVTSSRRREAGRSASSVSQSRVRSFHHAWFPHQDEHKTDFSPLDFSMSMSSNFTPSRTPHRRTSPVDGRQRRQMCDPLSDARLIRSGFFLLDPQCGGEDGGRGSFLND